MKTKNIVMSVVWVWLLSVWVFFSGTFFTSANPDYICTKTISWNACSYTSTSCWARRTDHTRVCTKSWQRVSSITYARTRTTCWAGRTTSRWGWYTWWDSWRKTADAYHYASCSSTYTETDSDKPTR